MTQELNFMKNWLYKIQTALRERLFTETFFVSSLGKYGFESIKNLFKLTRVPVIGPRLPQFASDKSNVSWIPINKNIEGAGQIELPEEILDRLIEKAEHRVIVNFCPCRKVNKCQNYPVELGCLMMGSSALKIPGKTSKEVGVDEAKAHVRKAIKSGLVPIAGKARIDNDLFLIPDEGKLLTVCLCCECCCVTRFTRYVVPETIHNILHPVEGLSIKVTDKCIGCGECVDHCYTNAISLAEGRAVIGERCAICGRCAGYCPHNAINLLLENKYAVDDMVRKIEGLVDF